jgi:hypothetical protein
MYLIYMTVQQFIAGQPESLQQLLVILRTWIRDLGPHVEEKMRAKVPYYYFYGHLCTLSPGDDNVEFSFAKGYELDDETKLLESKGRKHVRSLTFYSVAEAEEHEEEVRRLLNRAAILNEYQFKRKQKKR